MLDEGTLRECFPEIPWDQPVPVHIPEHGPWFVCRQCIALFGLNAEALIAGRVNYGFRRRADCLDHIEREHHD